MKHIRFVIKSVIVIILLCATHTQAERLPILEPNLADLTTEQAALVIKSMLDAGYQSFDFSRIGNHINLFEQIVKQTKNKIFIVGVQLKDLKKIKFKFNAPAGIAWSENGIGRKQLNELKNNRLLLEDGDQGVNKQCVDPLFFEDKNNLFFKLNFDPLQKINVDYLIHQAVVLYELNRSGKAAPAVSLPIQDDAYTDVDSAFLAIAQNHKCKLYQVLFSLLSRMKIHVLPIIAEPITSELNQEIMQSFKLQFGFDELKSLKHLPANIHLPKARL